MGKSMVSGYNFPLNQSIECSNPFKVQRQKECWEDQRLDAYVMLHPHFFNAIPIYKMAVFFFGGWGVPYIDIWYIFTYVYR